MDKNRVSEHQKYYSHDMTNYPKKGLISNSSLRPLGAKVINVYIQNNSLFKSKLSTLPPLRGHLIVSIPTYFKLDRYIMFSIHEMYSNRARYNTISDSTAMFRDPSFQCPSGLP